MPTFLDVQAFKDERRITHEEDDALIERLLDSAEAYLSDLNNGVLRRPVVSQEIIETFDSFDAVELAHPDEVSAHAVTYTDASGATATLDAYTLEGGRLVRDGAWPAKQGRVIVTYTAGWDVESVPEPIRDAGYFIAAHMYDHRDDFDAERYRQILAIMVSGYRRATL